MNWLDSPISETSKVTLGMMILKLVVAFAYGGGVALIYRFTREKDDIAPTFPGTLVLLSILIAMVTQVIGDSVARAFSLVGALSIVRFRTVVRDTQDTAYVIFSVIEGMAVGSGHFEVGIIGLVIVGIASVVIRVRKGVRIWDGADAILEVKMGISQDPEGALAGTLKRHLKRYEVSAVSTAKQGTALDLAYRAHFHPDSSPADLVRDLNKIEGVQSVELRRVDSEE